MATLKATLAFAAFLATSHAAVPTTMLAAKAAGSAPCTRHDFSCFEIKNVSVPRPLLGEALVRVSVSSVNPSDVDLAVGSIRKLFGTFGADFAGEVVAVGPLCSKLKVGDHVWGATKGAYAQYAIAICAITGKIEDVDPSLVGTLPEVGMTSAEALKKTGAPWDPAKNLTVVVTSGSGGTGFVGIQLARHYGAGKIITAASGPGIDFVRSMGADQVVDYKVQEIFSALANDTVDIVYDNYGAPGTADRAMAKLKKGGTFIFLPGKDAKLSKHPKEGVEQINYGLMIPSANTLNELLAIYDAGALKPHVQSTYPLANVSGAFSESASGHVIGKLAIAMP